MRTDLITGLLCALCVVGCNRGTSGPTDAAIAPTIGPLALTVELNPAVVDQLVVSGGGIELKRVSLFGDVTADARTMTSAVQLKLPGDTFDTEFAMAPYGLYSRVQVGLDDFHFNGTWRGAPLVIVFEAESSTVDVRAEALDYEPTQGAHFRLTIDASSWFDPAVLDSADGAGTTTGILVDARNNVPLIKTLTAAFQASFHLDEAPAL